MPNVSANRMNCSDKTKKSRQMDLEIEEYLNRMLKEPDDFVSANEYLNGKNAQRPPEFFEYMTPFDEELSEKKETKALKTGDITQLLTNAPGVLGCAGKFPKSIGKEIDDLPEVITNEIIPIYLDSKFFIVEPGTSIRYNVPVKNNVAAKKIIVATNKNKCAKQPHNGNRSNDSHPTIYASDKIRTVGRENGRQNAPEYFTPFEVYKLKRVSAFAAI